MTTVWDDGLRSVPVDKYFSYLTPQGAILVAQAGKGGGEPELET